MHRCSTLPPQDTPNLFPHTSLTERCTAQHAGSWHWVTLGRCPLWDSPPVAVITARAFTSPVPALPPPVLYRHQSDCSESYHFPS